MIDTPVVLIGLCLAVLAVAVVAWRGGPLERLVAAVGAICWVSAGVAQLVSGDPATPIVVADVAFSAFLLGLILRRHCGWLYGVFALEASRLVLHAMVYDHRIDPSPAYRLANNVLSTLVLLIVVVAALRRPSARATQEMGRSI